MNEPYFAESGPLVELIYDREGRPVAVVRGKVRDQAKNNEAMLKWLRALRDQILSGVNKESKG